MKSIGGARRGSYAMEERAPREGRVLDMGCWELWERGRKVDVGEKMATMAALPARSKWRSHAARSHLEAPRRKARRRGQKKQRARERLPGRRRAQRKMVARQAGMDEQAKPRRQGTTRTDWGRRGPGGTHHDCQFRIQRGESVTRRKEKPEEGDSGLREAMQERVKMSVDGRRWTVDGGGRRHVTAAAGCSGWRAGRQTDSCGGWPSPRLYLCSCR